MDSTVRDRRIAAAIPLVTLPVICVSLWFIPWLVLGYLLLGRRAPPLVREVTLRVLDLYLSLALIFVAVVLLIGSLGVVANDGEIKLWPQIKSVLVVVFSLLITGYVLVSSAFSVVRAWRGQLHDPKLSMGILQALRGRPRAAA